MLIKLPQRRVQYCRQSESRLLQLMSRHAAFLTRIRERQNNLGLNATIPVEPSVDLATRDLERFVIVSGIYRVAPIPNGLAYIVNRLTGAAWACNPANCRALGGQPPSGSKQITSQGQPAFMRLSGVVDQ